MSEGDVHKAKNTPEKCMHENTVSPLNLRAYKDLEGAIDIHLHTDPDNVPRLLTDREAAAQAKAVGMRAIMMKNHTSQSAARTILAKDAVGGGIELYGLICLNPAVGGMNVPAVENAIKMGVKGVWMPSMWSDHNVQYVKEMGHRMGDESIGTVFGDEGVKVVTEEGKLKPELIKIIEMVAEADIMLATGHVSCEHAHLILDEANRKGVKKLVVHTCNYHTMNYPIPDLQKMVEVNGAYLEFGFSSLPNPIWMPVKMERLWDLDRIVKAIKTVGPGHCILSTDSGQFTTASPIECVRLWGELLKAKGFTQAEVDLMTKVNPATVLGLDPDWKKVSNQRNKIDDTHDVCCGRPKTIFDAEEDITKIGRYDFPWPALNLRTYASLDGAIDINMHTAPDIIPRLLNDQEAVAQARAVNMIAVMLKCHTSMTAERAVGVKEALGGGIEVFGVICLNPAVYGINPDAVEHAINMGIKGVWMPTLWADYQVKKLNESKYSMGYETMDIDFGQEGVTIVDDQGDLKPEVIEVLEKVAEADIMLATGNISCHEAHLLLNKANELGITKLVVSNVIDSLLRYPMEDLEKMVKDNGAFLEFGHRALPYPIWWESSDPDSRYAFDEVCEMLKTFGAQHCILSSDAGQLTTASPIECMRMWPELLKIRGFSQEETDLMMKTNPAKVLGLNETE